MVPAGAAPVQAPPPPPAATVSAGPPAPARPPTVAVAPVLKRDRHGLALSLGLGLMYGLLGAQARYDIPVRPSLTVSPFVVAGVIGLLAGPVGVGAALGARHRLVLDVALAPQGRQGLYLHGTAIEGALIYGPVAGIGYEHMSDGGWIQRVTIDYGYAAWGSVLAIEDPHTLLFSAGFGRRFW